MFSRLIRICPSGQDCDRSKIKMLTYVPYMLRFLFPPFLDLRKNS